MSFDLQPVLKGEILGLRPLRKEDFHALYAVASDPLIWEQHPIRDRYKQEIFKEFFRESLESGGALIAIKSKNGRTIGSSRLDRQNLRSRRALEKIGGVRAGSGRDAGGRDSLVYQITRDIFKQQVKRQGASEKTRLGVAPSLL